jgi:myo-inositol 2-dehydrogenase/D-chiro-inositol 1-dehydrogenase
MRTHPASKAPLEPSSTGRFSRRSFVRQALTAAAAAPVLSAANVLSEKTNAQPSSATPAKAFERKLKLGLVGCGGRGSWIAKLFQSHGGYEIHCVADYFQEVADKCGDALGVPAGRRFSTLSGYKRVLESGVEAVVLETPPYCFPEHASAAVAAGLHVYMAKPVAVDVPGCLQIEAAGKLATEKNRCFLVDYQLPTDPAAIDVVKRLAAPGFGMIARVSTVGNCQSFADPPRTATIESRLQKLIWINDIALGCDYIGNYDIHALDAALWVIGQRPVAASGASRICRPNPHGDAHDVCAVTFEYENGIVHDHFGQALPNHLPGELSCRVSGVTGNAVLTYAGPVKLKSYDDAFSGESTNLYEAGVVRNIATFYENVTEGRFDNPTVRRSVDGVLAAILGREAGERRTRLTMDQVLKESRRLEVDLRGMKS